MHSSSHKWHSNLYLSEKNKSRSSLHKFFEKNPLTRQDGSVTIHVHATWELASKRNTEKFFRKFRKNVLTASKLHGILYLALGDRPEQILGN